MERCTQIQAIAKEIFESLSTSVTLLIGWKIKKDIFEWAFILEKEETFKAIIVINERYLSP